jgi:large subunit ribosomal protein L21
VYAIIETGGKQYRISEGDTIKIEKIEGEIGSTVELNNILMVSKDEEINVGSPLVRGAKATGEILDHGKDKKIVIFKHKRRKNYRKKQGHRQAYTSIKITGIQL